MVSVFGRIRNWWDDFSGKPSWKPAEELTDCTQFDERKMEDLLSDLDTLAEELSGQCGLCVVSQDYHTDDRNAKLILDSFFSGEDDNIVLMVENPYKEDFETPNYRIEHHWNSCAQTENKEVNSVHYGIPSSSSVISSLLWQKLVGRSDRRMRKDLVPQFGMIGYLGIEGYFFDSLEPECGLGGVVTSQLLEAGEAELVDWPFEGWDTQASTGVMSFIHGCAPEDYDEFRKKFVSRFGSLRVPAKELELMERVGVLKWLDLLAEKKSRVPVFDRGVLRKKGLVVYGEEIHEAGYFLKSRNDILAVQKGFHKLEGEREDGLEMRRPYCRLKVSDYYNLLDLQNRLEIEDFYLGFKRFNRMIDYRRIPNWHLPLVIIQPAHKLDKIKNVVYCKCHEIYHGVPGFNVGELMVDLAMRMEKTSGGGSELIGSICTKNNPYDAFSILSEELKKKIPKKMQYEEIPEKVQERALRMKTNPKLYQKYS